MTNETGARPSEPPLSRNPVSMGGALLTTLAAFAFVTYLVLDAFGLFASPYAGLLGFIALPALFLAGLLLIPLGMWIEGRRRRRGRAAWQWPPIELANSRTRTILLAVLLLTLINVAIVTVATSSGLHYMETNAFCGQVCHEPMEPQFTALPLSAHAKLNCVDCHVAPGAAGAVQAKLNGTRQLWELATNSYPRPIPSPRGRIPDVSVTCERCHAAPLGEFQVTRVIREHKDNETSSELLTTRHLFTGRIHWHARPDVVIEYVATDDTLAEIPYVKATVLGRETEYFFEGTTAPPVGQPLRRMDCLDCHNRPAHTLAFTPQQVVDRVINAGEVSTTVPFVRSEMVDALLEEHPEGTDVPAAIARRLTESLGTSAEAQNAVAVTQRLYRENVFPRMNVTWGTYRNNLAHADDGGCFRCHSDIHIAKDAPENRIRQECDLCHRDE